MNYQTQKLAQIFICSGCGEEQSKTSPVQATPGSMGEDLYELLRSPLEGDPMNDELVSRSEKEQPAAHVSSSPLAPNKDKDLPPRPGFTHKASEATVVVTNVNVLGSPSNLTRPSLAGQISFQRPRKRVNWRGKACIIALPFQDGFEETNGDKFYLKPQDVMERLEMWECRGFQTEGFSLSPALGAETEPHSEGQSRAVYPSPEDSIDERSSKHYRVSIPDRQEWDDYVNRLKEDKLRALGVSFENANSSLQNSPILRSLSRHASSPTSTRPISPALVTPLPNENLAQSSNHLSPRLAPSISIGSHMTAQIFPGPPKIEIANGNYLSRYSAGVENSLTPPYQFSHVASPLPGVWSSQQYLGSQTSSRVTTPSMNGGIPGFGPILTPGSMASPDYGNAIFNQISHGQSPRVHHRQAQSQTHPRLQNQEQHREVSQLDLMHTAMGSRPSSNGSNSTEGSDASEIASPVPRGHHKNLSETLQNGVDKAGSHFVALDTLADRSRKVSELAEELEGDRTERPPMLVNVPQSANKDQNLENSGVNANSSMICTSKLPGSSRVSPLQDHFSRTSLSKMNANAPEFVYNPKYLPPSDIFAFTSNQRVAQPVLEEYTGVSKSLDHASKKPFIDSTFNVAAASFVPAHKFNPPGPLRVFSFYSGGPSLELNNPQLKPAANNETPNVDKGISEASNSKKIFSNIILPDAGKPAKKSKAIPIVRPKQRDEDYAQDLDGQEDESGRITQADGRQKRIRHDKCEGDQLPLFADPNMGVQQTEDAGSSLKSDKVTILTHINRGDVPTYVTTPTRFEEINDGMTISVGSSHADQPKLLDADNTAWEPFSFDDVTDAANFNAARSDLRSPGPNSNRNSNVTISSSGDEPVLKSSFTKDLALSLTSADDLQPLTISVIRDVQQDSLPVSIDRADSPHSISRAEISVSLPPSPLTQVLSPDSPFLSYSLTRINDQDTAENIRPLGMTDKLRLDPPSPLALIDGITYLGSSYDEIDAVMKHLNEEESDLGVDRHSSPPKSRDLPRTSIADVQERVILNQFPARAHVETDAPSLGPNKIRESFQLMSPRDSDSLSTAQIENMEENIQHDLPYKLSNMSPEHNFPVQRMNRAEDLPVSDWDDAISSSDEMRFQSRIKFFDHRINDLVGSIVQQHLQPLEKALVGIQDLLSANSSKSSSSRNQRSTSADVGTSDADDEDESDNSLSRVKSPGKDRTYEKLKVLIMETVGLHPSHGPGGEIPEILEALKELKSSVQRPFQSSSEIKSMIEDVVARQMRGRSAPITSSHESATSEKLQLQITGLESMLKIADTRADDELKARRATEDALADNQRLLRMAMQEAAEQRESAEETERSLLNFHDERQQVLRQTAMLEGAQESLQNTASDLAAKNAALEETLDEYRLSSSQWREEVEEAKRDNKDLLRTIGVLKMEIEETIQGRQTLSNKFDRLQEDMTSASRDIARDQSRWRAREEEAAARFELLNVRLQSELRSKEEMESTIKRLNAQQKEAVESHIRLERSQRDNADLEELSAALKSKIAEQDRFLDQYERKEYHITEKAKFELQRVVEAKDAEIETASTQLKIVSSDLQAVIARLRGQINDAAADADAVKDRHEAVLRELVDFKNAALKDAADAKEAALEEHSRLHERVLLEAKSQYARAFENASEDKLRAEAYLNQRLALADDKICHLEDKSSHLEGKLEIAKSEAHAAALAIQTKKSASSQLGSVASYAGKDHDLPEKISPQALRESILVLQEQLQERESHVEQLERELLQFDREAPEKLKNQTIEITWLRELLCVRVDDLEEVINTLSYPTYDREAVRDAAIRIRANLQMQQQGRERVVATNSSFPSLSSISTLASSPRVLPLAAAAAWGNWRKTQDTSSKNIVAVEYDGGSQTPPHSPPPARGFLSGLLTPPRTNIRQLSSNKETSYRARTASPASSTSKATLIPGTDEQDVMRDSQSKALAPVHPSTSFPLMQESSYDCDAESIGFGGEVGDLAAESHVIKFERTSRDETLEPSPEDL